VIIITKEGFCYGYNKPTVKKIVNDKIFILEPLSKGIISNVSLADQLKPEIESELRKKVKTHAIVMALRRYTDEIQKKHKETTFDYSSEIILKQKSAILH